ncbi:urease accessory protein UreD [Labrys monachus]|uniref:Urease accessory protein UreD n=1 Tax=Labrys monachus TaxID=217067 RepID=A0ABU0FQ62_9HYPH|nr:urease accessory protein UreD [Labrys monachus]MDQ0396254.1 urease accessory protein [Labrys monachus]
MTLSVAEPTLLERAWGRVFLGVAPRDGRHAVAELSQSGCGRLLFPAVARDAALEAVIINTSGGLTGGDVFKADIHLESGTKAVLTTQACEKIYRSDGTDADVETRLHVEEGAALAWLPQETILFDGARLKRRLIVDMGETSNLLAMEAVLLGRKASGESLTRGLFRDSWRVRRGGRLVYADETAFEGDLAARIGAAAALKGASAYATVLLAAPDAASRLDAAREVLNNEAAEGGISTFDGLCVGRLIAQDGAALRRVLVALLRALGGELPRVWHN